MQTPQGFPAAGLRAAHASGADATDDATVVSPGSPMGAALLGAAVGDEVEYEAPSGAILKVRVLAID